MNEMLIAIFDTEDAAAKGLQTLRDLHRDGGISLYASALIVKDTAGEITIRERSGAQPLGTALGLLTGGIVGLLGGPGGLAIGASVGAYLGLLADCARIGIDLKFLEDAGKALSAGKAAVLADIEENWVLVVEPRLREQGGIVMRRFRSDVVADQLLQESKALQQELEALEGQLDRTNAANIAAAETRIREVKHQLEAIESRARATMDLKKAETDLKVQALRSLGETAAPDAKTRIKRRIAEAQADFRVRSKKLSQALALAKEAIGPGAGGSAP